MLGSWQMDAMGRWYCCTDPSVTLPTLQDVFETSKSPKNAVAPKAVPTKPCVELSSCKDIPSMSKGDKVPSSLRVKFNISGSSISRRVPPTIDRKADMHESKHENEWGCEGHSVGEKLDNNKSPIVNQNGCNKNKIFVGETCPSIAVASESIVNQNGAFNSVKPNLYEANGTMGRMTTEKGSIRLELQNGEENCYPGSPELKRKLKDDSCILFAQDSHSQAKVKEMREVYVKFHRNGFTNLPDINYANKDVVKKPYY
ncbi:hypothetical protein GH714_011613 [Hevea brasiliensis]|uniref:Uncharacterized protein n=1 Tax=Hevea brasiliensis TaxID=3981 RepID=A0A6A6KBN5_HEVBR|nr:hypothetical protein GH714_011613 [Hevea brasiliensis]